jgi:hypothetical protein
VEVHNYEGTVCALPKWLGADHGKCSIDRLPIAPPLGERQAQDFQCVQAVLSKCLPFVDDPVILIPTGQ